MSELPDYIKDTQINPIINNESDEDEEYYNEEEVFYPTEMEIVKDIYDDIKMECDESVLPLFDLLTEEDLMTFLNFNEE
jgi:hypothetical protein